MFNTKSQIRKGPLESIICEPPHDRPIFSLAVGEKKFVTGSADHGLREYEMLRFTYIDKVASMFDNYLGKNMGISNGLVLVAILLQEKLLVEAWTLLCVFGRVNL